VSGRAARFRPGLGEPEFVEALRERSARYWHKHSFHIRMHEGQLSRREIQMWAANRYYYQKSVPIKDAAILSNCPDPDVRRHWIERIIYHDGLAGDEGGRDRWVRLAMATGLSEDEILDDRHVIPGVRFAVDAYVNFARTRPWIESVAASLTELFAPDLMRERLAALRRHYEWIDPAGLAYFEGRPAQATKEGAYALELVTRHCVTAEQRERALAALDFKCDVLWSLLDSIEHSVACAT